MRSVVRFACAVLLLPVTVGCASPEVHRAVPAAPIAGPSALPPTTIPTPAPTPGSEIAEPRPQYVLSATLDYAAHHLAVSEVVTYTNRTTEPLAGLLFVVEPNRHAGVFRLKRLTGSDGRPLVGSVLRSDRLQVPLPQPLPPGESIRLALSFDLVLPARAGAFGYTARQVNLGDWYPFLPPYDPARGWQVHDHAPVGKPLVYDASDYRVDIALTGPATQVTLAASAPGEIVGGRYRYRLEAARNFALSASPEYVTLSRPAGPATVVSYFFPEHRAAGEAVLQVTAEALTLFSGRFGPYPHAGLAAVEADFLDGMEFDGLFFLGRGFYAAYPGTPQSYLTAIAAHETAHQWWGGLVGNDQALEPWLDEALATYSERLFYEAVYPERVDWWWEYRVALFHPTGWVDSTIYDHTAFRSYINAVYLRGADFLEALRREVGDPVFFAVLKDYAGRHAHGQASAADFFALLTEHSPVDVQELLEEYFAER